MEPTKRNRLGVFIIFALMFISPFIENTRGIFLPLFKEEFSVSNTAISTMIVVSQVLGMSVSFMGGAITERFGQKRTIFMGMVCLIFGILFQSQAVSFSMFFLGYIPIVMGVNLYNVASNTIVPFLFLGMQTVAMNLLHFMYGAGSTVSQNLVGLLLLRDVGWRRMYVYIAMMYLFVLLLSRFATIPDAPRAEPLEGKQSGLLRNPLIYAYGLGLGFYAFTEQGISLWLTNFLKDVYGFQESLGARYTGIFFLVFALGRLLGGFAVQRIGVLRGILISLSISLVMLVTGLLLGESAIIVVSLSGVFFSIVYPSLMSSVSRVFKERPAFATGIIITLVSLSLNFMNLIMGVATDRFGAAVSIYLLPVSLFIALCAMVFITLRTRRGTGMWKEASE